MAGAGKPGQGGMPGDAAAPSKYRGAQGLDPEFIKSLEKRPPHIVKGTAVFLTSDPEFVPTALLHNLKHNKVLHEKNVILTIETAQMPRVDISDRVRMTPISEKFQQVTLKFGFMETPNIPKALPACRARGWKFDVMRTSFFLSRRSLKPSDRSAANASITVVLPAPASPPISTNRLPSRTTSSSTRRS